MDDWVSIFLTVAAEVKSEASIHDVYLQFLGVLWEYCSLSESYKYISKSAVVNKK